MQIFEYSLKLGTGETILITEVPVGAMNSSVQQAFNNPRSLEMVFSIIALCTKVPRQVLEDAKIGYTKPLENLLRTPPAGALMKLDYPVCANINDCIMATDKCTARAGMKNPECWEYSPTNHDLEIDTITAKEIARTVVMAWRDGRHVIISC